MTRDDFAMIENFTEREVLRTGADLHMVKFNTLHKLDLFRITCNRRIKLIKHGMTSGKHSSIYHPNGEAIDFTFYHKDGYVDVSKMFKNALYTGFKGIGFYWNSRIISMHLDTGVDYRFWSAEKFLRERKWRYLPLIIDPRD